MSALKEKRPEYALEYAGFWIRIGAGLIDLSILIVGLYILYCVVQQSLFWIFPSVSAIIATLRDIAYGAPLTGRFIWLASVVVLIFLIVATIYFVGCWASTGQTLGKLSLGIKVIRTDSSPVDLRCSFIRFLAGMLCVFTLGIGFIMIAFDGKKQGWHDRLADTYVVKLPVKQVAYNESLASGGAR